jgi:hypothetical protein
MSAARGFWWLLSWACVLWYGTLTAYVAVKGVRDIGRMLRRLGKSRSSAP